MQLNFDGQSPVDISLEILRAYQPSEGYYLAFSGGKDSVVLKALADESGVKYDAHYNVTGIDPPELVRFIRKHHKDVHMEPPKMTFWAGLRRKGPPTRNVRWCCEVLKEHGGEGRIVLAGVRRQESAKRAKYGVVALCSRVSKTLVYPMLHWTSSDVWEYIQSESLPYCSLYDEGWKRLGCVLCPFNCRVAQAKAKWPMLFNRFEKAVADWFLVPEPDSRRRFKSADELLAWWYGRDAKWDNEQSPVLPFDQFEDDP